MKSIFKTFILSVLVFAQVHFAFAQTASILPPAKTTFNDSNGKPLVNGTVDFYIPSTTTRKTTWQDAAETVPNANPVVLDPSGRALILGSGSYRQVVKDRLGNTVWDQVTSSAGSGGGSTPTATGDGDLVGTIKPWAGLTAPNQYLFTYGQELSRTTYSALFTAITSSQAVFCSSGSPILTGLGDTTNFPIGAAVEVSCIAAGFTTIVSKTTSTITLAVNANVSTNTNAVIFPWGNGNHTNTFNLPDFRGFAIAGNNNMGGVASTNLTTAFFGSANPNSIGAAGGSQSRVLLAANLPPITPSGTVAVAGVQTVIPVRNFTTIGGTDATKISLSGSSGTDAGTFSSTSGSATATFTGTAGSGTSTAFGTVQPTKTSNYIIKVTPDANSATASGVTDLGGMTGSIACGTGLVCTGNNISSSVIGSNPTALVGLTAINGSSPNFMRADAANALDVGISPIWTAVHTFNANIGFGGQLVPTAPIHVGGVAAASSGSNILSARASTGATSVHGFAENSTINLSANGQGMDSYDARMVVSGTATYDHLVSYQSRAIYGSAGTITNAYGGWDQFTANGPVTNQYGWYAALPTGTSTITNSYGFYAEALTKGSTLNYAFFAAGTTKSKFTGGLEGTTTNDNACAGCIGEYIESVIPSGSATALTTATAKTVTSISLTAGDWDVSCVDYYVFGTGTTSTDFRASLSLVTNTEDTTAGRFTHLVLPTLTGTGITQSLSVPNYRFSLSGTTSIFLIAQSTFATSTMSAYGIIRARRIR